MTTPIAPPASTEYFCVVLGASVRTVNASVIITSGSKATLPSSAAPPRGKPLTAQTRHRPARIHGWQVGCRFFRHRIRTKKGDQVKKTLRNRPSLVAYSLKETIEGRSTSSDFRRAFKILLQSRFAPRFIHVHIIYLITGALWLKLCGGFSFLKISSESKCRRKCLSIFHFCLHPQDLRTRHHTETLNNV